MISAAQHLRFLAHEAARCRTVATRCRLNPQLELWDALDTLEAFTLLLPSLLEQQGLQPMDSLESAAFKEELREALTKKNSGALQRAA